MVLVKLIIARSGVVVWDDGGVVVEKSGLSCVVGTVERGRREV